MGSEPRLALIVLKTRQIDKLLGFYQAIGIPFVEEQHGRGPRHFAGKLGDTVLEIYPLKDGEADRTTRLGFSVENLYAVIQTLVQRKLAPEMTPTTSDWGLRVVVADPDGRAVELYGVHKLR